MIYIYILLLILLLLLLFILTTMEVERMDLKCILFSSQPSIGMSCPAERRTEKVMTINLTEVLHCDFYSWFLHTSTRNYKITCLDMTSVVWRTFFAEVKNECFNATATMLPWDHTTEYNERKQQDTPIFMINKYGYLLEDIKKCIKKTYCARWRE